MTLDSRHRFFDIVATLVVLLTAGCGGKVDTSKASQTDVAVGGVGRDELPAATRKSICEGVADCCGAIGQQIDMAACEAYFEQIVDFGYPPPDTANYNPLIGTQCIEQIRTSLAECITLGDPPACVKMFSGLVPPGSKCTNYYECAAPANGYAQCEQSADLRSTRCVPYAPAHRVAQGQSCGGTCMNDGTCYVDATSNGSMTSTPAGCYHSDGLHCSPRSKTCRPLQAIGDGCTSTADCAPGAACSPERNACVARSLDGEYCAGWNNLCVSGTWCNFDWLCESKKSNGETCSSDQECNDYCLIPADYADGVCASGPRRFVPTETLCQSWVADSSAVPL